MHGRTARQRENPRDGCPQGFFVVRELLRRRRAIRRHDLPRVLSDRSTAALSAATDPRSVFVDHPDDADQWRLMAARVDEVIFEIATVDVEDVWTGLAAEAFIDRLKLHLGRWKRVADSYRSGAATIDSYAEVLETSQREAERAIVLYESGMRLHAAAVKRAERAAASGAGGTGSAAAAQITAAMSGTAGSADMLEAEQMMSAAVRSSAIAASTAEGQLTRSAEVWKGIVAATLALSWVQLEQGAQVLASLGDHLSESLWMIADGMGMFVGLGAGAAGGGALLATFGGGSRAAGTAGSAVGGIAPGSAAGITSWQDHRWEARGPDRGDGRFHDGTYTRGDVAYYDAKKLEQEALDQVEIEFGVPVERKQVTVHVIGELQNGRRYDGLILKPDGTYTGVEIKTGDAVGPRTQRHFDSLVSYENPAIGTLNGKEIRITDVYQPENWK